VLCPKHGNEGDGARYNEEATDRERRPDRAPPRLRSGAALRRSVGGR